ncbi:MAG: ComF family protein [Firmicutes bacterium]|nr:ComF family protein [Bacillota bacterium]
MKRLRDWLQVLEDLLLPPVAPCGLCQEHPSLPLGACQVCLSSLAISWERWEVQGHACFSLFPYQGFGRELVHQMKYHGGYKQAATLGVFLGLAAREEPELAKVDLLVPVPLATGRLEQRGFNQAVVLADNIREVWKRPVCHGVLRIRETESQSGLSSARRKRNVRGAFAVLPGIDVQGKSCLIVDDVITSGNTFGALAQLIQDYGGKPMGIFAGRTKRYKE